MEHVPIGVRRPNYVLCPYDGSSLEPVPDAHGRPVPTCRQCGFKDWGNPKPCVAVLVVQDGRLLLARRAVEPAKGEWDVLGGFIDAGETAEHAAAREMLEETGLTVRVTRYLGSLVDTYGPRGDPTLNLIFVAEPTGGTPTAKSDVAELRWFDAAELPRTMAFTHQHEVLRRWRENEQSKSR